jgi:hypothetical protein
MKDFTVFYHVWYSRMFGDSFNATHLTKISARSGNIEEIQSELEKIGVFGADIFCVLNGHHDNVLED